MLNIFIDSIIFFLVIYALLNISARIADFAFKNPPSENFHVVMKATNSDDLEYNIRYDAKKCVASGLKLIILCDSISC